MSIHVHLSLAEQFMNWFPGNTKLYIRGQQGKDPSIQRQMDYDLFHQIKSFFEQRGITKLRGELISTQEKLRAWREVHRAWIRIQKVGPTASNNRRLAEAIEKAEALDVDPKK